MIVLWTQKDIATKLSISPEYLWEVKKGKKNLSKKRQALLKQFYQDKIKELDNICKLISIEGA